MTDYPLAPNERVVRHPNGHLMIERLPLPSEEDFAKKYASLAKAWPILAKHADHIDGEFDLALTDLKAMVLRQREYITHIERFKGESPQHVCGATSEDGWHCTRVGGHDGWHKSVRPEQVYASWPQR